MRMILLSDVRHRTSETRYFPVHETLYKNDGRRVIVSGSIRNFRFYHYSKQKAAEAAFFMILRDGLISTETRQGSSGCFGFISEPLRQP